MPAPNPESINQNNLKAFLVVEGSNVFVINQPVINIGRKSDNHIVVDDEHVSRYHAQIRRIKGRYVLLDLNSTVGTSVNGKRVEQSFLRPGDVISLGGIPIIFGQAHENPKINAVDLGQHNNVGTGPTESTDINSADNYLDFFNTTDE